MIESIVLYLTESILPLGVFGVFFASLLEEIIAPIPSAIVQMTSGFIFIHGTFSIPLIGATFFKVVIPAAIGVTLGSLFVYFITYFLGRPAIEKWGKYLGIFWSDVEQAQIKFENAKRDEITLFLLRTIPIIPSVAITAFCGLVRYNLKSYLLLTFLGTVIRSFILALLGWKVGELYSVYADIIARFESIILILLVLIVLSYILYRIWKKGKKNKSTL